MATVARAPAHASSPACPPGRSRRRRSSPSGWLRRPPGGGRPRRPGSPRSGRRRSPSGGWTPAPSSSACSAARTSRAKRWVYEQYDQQVGTNTVAGPGQGAAVLRVEGTRRGLVATTDADQAVAALDPYLGTVLSVAEATRNVSITGSRPLGVTSCLNFGDLTRPDAFWQFREAVRGLGEACRAFGIPVTGGTVSLRQEAPGSAIAPTPEIGVVGLLDDVELAVGPALVADGDAILLVGETGPGLAGSAYAALAGLAPEDGPPAIDLDREVALQAFVREAIGARLIAAAQDVGAGGLATALAEMAMWGDRGGALRLAVSDSPATALFGESPSRVILEARPELVGPLSERAAAAGLPFAVLGTVGGHRLFLDLVGEGATGAAEERGARIADALDVPLAELRHAWEQGLPRALGEES